jgi:hypothetical protein
MKALRTKSKATKEKERTEKKIENKGKRTSEELGLQQHDTSKR